MPNKKFSGFEGLGGLVFSTDRDMDLGQREDTAEATLPPEKQKLRIAVETAGRKGKKATIVHGYQGKDEDLEELTRELKKHCGVGGSAKDGLSIIQGDVKDKVLRFLLDKGYKAR